jgi:hypothetical protein
MKDQAMQSVADAILYMPGATAHSFTSFDNAVCAQKNGHPQVPERREKIFFSGGKRFRRGRSGQDPRAPHLPAHASR